MANNLTPQLSLAQLKQNIDALQKGGTKAADVQAYVDNYQSDGKGGYVLKSQQAAPAASQSNPLYDFAGGVDKSVMGTIGGVASLGRKIGDALSNIPGLEYLKTPDSSPAAKTITTVQNASQPKNAAETAGKVAGDVVQFFIPGGAEADAGKVASIASDALKTGGITAAQSGNPQDAITGAAAGAVAAPVGKALEATGAGVAKMFIPKSDAEAGMLQAYKAATPFIDRVKALVGEGTAKAPTTAASTAFDKGLMGTESMIGVQAKRAQTTLWNGLIKPALDQSEAKVNIPSFLDEAATGIKNSVADPTRQKTLLNALDSIKEDFSGINDISLAQLQKFKEGWADFVPEKAYKGQPIAGALNDVRNVLAGMARSKIYSELGDNVRQAYLDYGNLHGITALGRKAMTGAIKGGTGTTLKNLLEMATVPIGTVGGQTIYKVGKGIELFGKAGASTVRDVLGIGSNQSGK